MYGNGQQKNMGKKQLQEEETTKAIGDVLPAGAREHAVEESLFEYTGFRVVMYKDVFKTNDVKEFKVVAGSSSSAYVDNLGNIYMCGWGIYGQLGNGIMDSNSSKFGKIRSENKFNELAIDIGTIAIDKEGNLWEWGHIRMNSTTTAIPRKMTDNTTIYTQVVAGDRSYLALNEDGNLWAIGLNNYGQLGDGTKTNINTLKQITDYTIDGIKFSRIAKGKSHSSAIDENGNIWTWGANSKGQLGDGTKTDATKPKQITDYAIDKAKFIEISCGNSHTIALDEEGNIWTWGDSRRWSIRT